MLRRGRFRPCRNRIRRGGQTRRRNRIRSREGILAFNCESLEELEVIDGIAGRTGRRARVALRINPDVDPQTHKNISTGRADSKFGIAYTEIEQAMRTHRIASEHIHSRTALPHRFADTEHEGVRIPCKRVVSIMSWFEERGVKITYVNVGGGLGINYESPARNPYPISTPTSAYSPTTCL